MSDEDPVVHVCAGPPLCELQGQAAVEACNAGCPLCRHIVCHPDGTETEFQRKPN